MEIVSLIGYYGYLIIAILVFTRLILYVNTKRILYVLLFSLGFFVNLIMNIQLKKWIRDPRPTNPIPLFIPVWAWSLFQGKIEWKTDSSVYVGDAEFGFPSGHAQLAFYGLSFLYWFAVLVVKKNPMDIWYWTCLLIACITFVQRYKYRRHSLEQLIFGSLLGFIMGWATVSLIKTHLLDMPFLIGL